MASRKVTFKQPANKKQALGHPSSSQPSQSQDIVRERPSAEFTKRKIDHEWIFPTDQMKTREECKWTLDFLLNNKMMHITVPPAQEIYPRLVRLFYQHLKSEQDYFEFSIDGHKRKINEEDMARILRLPCKYDASRMPFLLAPLSFSYSQEQYEAIFEDFSTDGSKGSGATISVSSFPERVWLLDMIYKKNLFPLGHRSERRAELLWATYSAHKGRFYSLPKMVLAGISKMGDEIRGRTVTGKTRALPYAYLITAILEYTGYPLADREPEMDVDQSLPLTIWTASYSKSLASKRKRAEKKRAARTPAGEASTSTAEPEPTTTRGRSRRSTTTTSADMEARIVRIETRQESIIDWQQNMEDVIIAMGRHQMGDQYDDLVTAQRRRREMAKTCMGNLEDEETAAEDDSDDSGDDYTERTTAGDDDAAGGDGDADDAESSGESGEE